MNLKKKIERVAPREGYDLWSSTYDSTPNPVVAMDARYTIDRLSPAPDELILDAGCGTGRNLEPLIRAGSNPIGIDFSEGMLRIARRKHPETPVAIVDLEKPLPFASEVFDAVLCALIGEHLTRLEDLYHELFRILKHGGRLAFSVYHPNMSAAGIEANFERSNTEYRLGAVHYETDEHIRFLTRSSFVDIGIDEFAGDDDLIKSIPQASKYLGSPILLVLTARKN